MNINITKETEDALSNIAKKHNTTVDYLVEEAILNFLEDFEDIEDALKGQKCRLDGDKGIKSNEFYKQLGI
mgnify:FL=1